jgi:L-seryl-tRNA(Ser) seleniumtransferase
MAERNLSGSGTRRRIPRTDAALADPRLADAVARLGRDQVKAAVVAAQQQARRGEIAPEQVVDQVAATLPVRATGLRPVINATGVLVHTNLGRSPLSPAAIETVTAAAGYVDVELDLSSGRRSARGRSAMIALAAAVPSAEAVHLVNNNAAALVLAATALAGGQEIVISRGELVEIGDGFRIPDLLTSTGARLKEVGTTNRTTIDDYAAAIGPDTGFVLKVHPSNFRVEGFTGVASLAQLAALGPPLIVDIGSGLLEPEPLLPDEPDASSALRAGADLVTASGDKLLGGPQAGLLFGRADLITTLRRHPLARALRVDKLTLAAVEATVAGPKPPLTRFLHADRTELRRRAEAIAAALDTRVVESEAVVGGGGAPGVALPSVAVVVPEGLAEPLRAADPAVLGRVTGGSLLLDLRAVDPALDAKLIAAVDAARSSCT